MAPKMLGLGGGFLVFIYTFSFLNLSYRSKIYIFEKFLKYGYQTYVINQYMSKADCFIYLFKTSLSLKSLKLRGFILVFDFLFKANFHIYRGLF